MLGSLITAGASLVGGFMGMKGQESANAQTAASTQAQIDFQREMATTQYQRQVEDLKAAGLNPAYGMYAGGASVPSGASYTAKNEALPVASALMAQAQINNLEASARKTNAEASITEEMGMQQARANFDATMAKVGLNAQQANLAAMQTDKAIAEIMTERERPAQVRQLVHLMTAQEKESMMRSLTEEQRASMLQAQTKLILEQTNLTAADVAAMEQSGNLGRLVKEYGPGAELILDVIRTVKPRR